MYEDYRPKSLPREEWRRRHEDQLRSFKQPVEVRIVCSHKSRSILNKRPATLGVAIVETATKDRRVFLNWNPVVGNMNNRMNREATYNPVAVDEAVFPKSPEERAEQGIPDDYMSTSDAEGVKRRGVKGMTSTRRNAVSNHHADQYICPQCTMHVNRDTQTMKRIFRGLAEAGKDTLDIQHIDTYAAMLPKPVFDWQTML